MSVEETLEFSPRFNEDGLIAAVAQDWRTGQILMLAWMNEQALRKTLETGEAHYWSRSRGELWHKGATSGAFQSVKEILVDCDQDAVILKIDQRGGGACHTGRKSCFYRRLELGSRPYPPVLGETGPSSPLGLAGLWKLFYTYFR